MSTHEVVASQIKAERLQTRAATSSEYIDELAEQMTAGDVFPAIVLFTDGKESWLADGIHRLDAAIKAKKKIGVDTRKGTRADAVEYACGANISHGLRRTNADKRRSVLLALSEFPSWSDLKIAETCGVSHPFVRSIRPQVVTVTTSPNQSGGEKRVGRDGKQYPASKTKDGRRPISAGVTFDVEEIESASEVSVEERMADWNRQVESFARSITTLADEAPKGGWWDDSQANITYQQLKSAAGSVRQAKCDKVCPLCDGQGCKRCKDTGFMPKRTYEMAGGK